MKSRWGDIIESSWGNRWLILAFFLIAFLFNWPYLKSGFLGDDYILLNLMNRDPAPYSWWNGMWSVNEFAFLDRIWWKEWHDVGTSGVFWRPLPSLVIETFINIFGRVAWPLHLLSIVIHGAVAANLYLFVRRATKTAGLAVLSALFFVTCEDHSMTVGWIATMTDLLAGLFAVIALRSALSWLQQRSYSALVIMLLTTISALACKESAVVLPIVLMLLVLLYQRAPSEPASDRFIARLRYLTPVLLPLTIIIVAYVTFYRQANLGALNNLLYVNPLVNPWGFIAQAAGNLPILWLGAFSSFPLATIMIVPDLALPLAIVGAVVFGAWFVAFWKLRQQRFILWLGLAFMLLLLPQLSTDASERGLYLPMIPCAVLLAIAAVQIGPLAGRFRHPFQAKSRWLRIMGWVAVLGILLPGMALSAVSATAYARSFGRPAAEVRTALPHINHSQPDHVVILNTSGMMMTLYAYDIINYYSQEEVDVWTLSSANGKFRLTYNDEDSFTIKTDRAGWLGNMFARLFRTQRELNPEQSYETLLFAATLGRLTPSQRDVYEVTFAFRGPLSDSNILFLAWDGSTFVPVDWAAMEFGDEIELADTSDLWGSMM